MATTSIAPTPSSSPASTATPVAAPFTSAPVANTPVAVVIPGLPAATASAPMVIQVIATPDPDGYQKLTALSTPMLALVAGYIAWRQWRTSRQALKNALFDRRFAAYSAASKIVMLLKEDKTVAEQEVKALVDAMTGIEFLLNAAVATFSKELKERIARRALAQAEVLDASLTLYNPAEAARAKRDYQSELTWFKAQPAALELLMGGYLRLSH